MEIKLEPAFPDMNSAALYGSLVRMENALTSFYEHAIQYVQGLMDKSGVTGYSLRLQKTLNTLPLYSSHPDGYPTLTFSYYKATVFLFETAEPTNATSVGLAILKNPYAYNSASPEERAAIDAYFDKRSCILTSSPVEVALAALTKELQWVKK